MVMYTGEFTKPRTCPGQDMHAQKRTEKTLHIHYWVTYKLGANRK